MIGLGRAHSLEPLLRELAPLCAVGDGDEDAARADGGGAPAARATRAAAAAARHAALQPHAAHSAAADLSFEADDAALLGQLLAGPGAWDLPPLTEEALSWPRRDLGRANSLLSLGGGDNAAHTLETLFPAVAAATASLDLDLRDLRDLRDLPASGGAPFLDGGFDVDACQAAAPASLEASDPLEAGDHAALAAVDSDAESDHTEGDESEVDDPAPALLRASSVKPEPSPAPPARPCVSPPQLQLRRAAPPSPPPKLGPLPVRQRVAPIRLRLSAAQAPAAGARRRVRRQLASAAAIAAVGTAAPAAPASVANTTTSRTTSTTTTTTTKTATPAKRRPRSAKRQPAKRATSTAAGTAKRAAAVVAAAGGTAAKRKRAAEAAPPAAKRSRQAMSVVARGKDVSLPAYRRLHQAICDEVELAPGKTMRNFKSLEDRLSRDPCPEMVAACKNLRQEIKKLYSERRRRRQLLGWKRLEAAAGAKPRSRGANRAAVRAVLAEWFQDKPFLGPDFLDALAGHLTSVLAQGGGSPGSPLAMPGTVKDAMLALHRGPYKDRFRAISAEVFGDLFTAADIALVVLSSCTCAICVADWRTTEIAKRTEDAHVRLHYTRRSAAQAARLLDLHEQIRSPSALLAAVRREPTMRSWQAEDVAESLRSVHNPLVCSSCALQRD